MTVRSGDMGQQRKKIPVSNVAYGIDLRSDLTHFLVQKLTIFICQLCCVLGGLKYLFYSNPFSRGSRKFSFVHFSTATFSYHLQ